MRLIRKLFFSITTFFLTLLLIFMSFTFVGCQVFDRFVNQKEYKKLFRQSDYQFEVVDNQYLLVKGDHTVYFLKDQEVETTSFLTRPLGLLVYNNHSFDVQDLDHLEKGTTLIVFDVDEKNSSIRINDNQYRLEKFYGDFDHPLSLSKLLPIDQQQEYYQFANAN